MIIKFDSKLSFMKPLNLLVLIYSYMSANFNDIRYYSQWSYAILLRTL